MDKYAHLRAKVADKEAYYGSMWDDVRALLEEVDAPCAECAEKDAQLAALKAGIDSMESFCGYCYEARGTWEEIQEHIKTCEAHPLVQANARIAALQAQVAEYGSVLDQMRRAFRDEGVFHVLQAMIGDLLTTTPEVIARVKAYTDGAGVWWPFDKSDRSSLDAAVKAHDGGLKPLPVTALILSREEVHDA